MLVPQALCFEILLVGGIVQFLEDVLEAAVVFLEDCVLGAQVQWIFAVKRVLEGRMREIHDAFVVIVHSLEDIESQRKSQENLNFLLTIATPGPL